MQTPPSVFVRPARHYDEEVIGIYFPWDKELNDAVKRIEGVKYSRTMSAWYLKFSPGVWKEIQLAFEGIGPVSIEGFIPEACGNENVLVGKCVVRVQTVAHSQALQRSNSIKLL